MTRVLGVINNYDSPKNNFWKKCYILEQPLSLCVLTYLKLAKSSLIRG